MLPSIAPFIVIMNARRREEERREREYYEDTHHDEDDLYPSWDYDYYCSDEIPDSGGCLAAIITIVGILLISFLLTCIIV